MQLFTNGQKARISGAPHKYFVVAHLGSMERLRASASASVAESDPLLRPGDLYVACGRQHPALYSDYAVLRGDSVSWVAGCMPSELQAAFVVAQESFYKSSGSNSGSSEFAAMTLDTGSPLEFPYMVQHGHLETPVPCAISFRFHSHTPPLTDTGTGGGGGEGGFDVVLRMQRPEWAICPGQVAAIYRGRECLGGGKVKAFGNTLKVNADIL